MTLMTETTIVDADTWQIPHAHEYATAARVRWLSGGRPVQPRISGTNNQSRVKRMVSLVDQLKDAHVDQVLNLFGPVYTSYLLPHLSKILNWTSMATATVALNCCPAARRPSRHIRARAGSTRKVGGLDAPIELENGKATSGPDLSINVNGMQLPNPFVIGSGPPGTYTRAPIASGSYAKHRLNSIRVRNFQERTIEL